MGIIFESISSRLVRMQLTTDRLKKIISVEPVCHLLSSLNRVSQDESVRDLLGTQLSPDIRNFVFQVVIVIDGTPVID